MIANVQTRDQAKNILDVEDRSADNGCMSKKEGWFLFFTALGGLGGLACILQWLGITPKDLRMTVTLPHVLWLVTGLLLFASSMLLSAWFGIAQRRTIEKLEEQISENAGRTDITIAAELLKEREAHQAEIRKLESASRQCSEELRESANRNLEYRAKLSLLSAIQWEALELAEELRDFLKDLGPPPSPKYTVDEIRQMPDARRKKLNDENDGEYIESCEYHFGKGSMRLTEDGLYNQLNMHNLRMWPWYDKVQASYEERFATKVQSLQRRFVIAEISAGTLGLPIGGPDGTKNIRTIASKLWELAAKVKEKELPNDIDPRLSEGH